MELNERQQISSGSDIQCIEGKQGWLFTQDVSLQETLKMLASHLHWLLIVFQYLTLIFL